MTNAINDGQESFVGAVWLQATALLHTDEFFQLDARCEKLANRDRFGTSDPFLRILVNSDGAGSPLKDPIMFETKVLYNNLNPTWPAITIKTQGPYSSATEIEIQVRLQVLGFC